MTTQERNIKVLALDILALRDRRNGYTQSGNAARATECQNEVNDRFQSADNRGIGDLVRAEIIKLREQHGADVYSLDRTFVQAKPVQVDWVQLLAAL